MNQLLVIALGGAFGAMLRFGIAHWVHTQLPHRFPTGVLLVNVLGSFLIGLLATWLFDRMQLGPQWRALILIGFLGSFTTFSTFSFDTITLVEQGSYWLAGSYVTLSLVLCLLATFFGIFIGRSL